MGEASVNAEPKTNATTEWEGTYDRRDDEGHGRVAEELEEPGRAGRVETVVSLLGVRDMESEGGSRERGVGLESLEAAAETELDLTAVAERVGAPGPAEEKRGRGR